MLWVGAAPGNAGGRGRGELGAHGTRIPFGGDIAGANLEVLMGSAGVHRNETFIVAALNQLPARGGGEPRPAEILAPVGACANSLVLLRDTLLAAGPALVVALGNVAVRAVAGAVRSPAPDRLPGLAAVARQGLERHASRPIAAALESDAAFCAGWAARHRKADLPALLWTLHPSAQNMSPFAGAHTVFHERMLVTREAVRGAVREALGREPPETRRALPTDGIYGLPEWRTLIAPRLDGMLERWAAYGL